MLIPNASGCLEPWQQCQRVIAAYEPEIVRRKSELHHAFSRLGWGDKRMVAAEQNLRGWDETRECRNRRSVGSTGDIVVETFEFVFNSVGCDFSNVLGPVLEHTAEQHWHVSARVGEDETNVLESRKRTGKKQIRDCPSGILWNFNEYWGDIRQQCSTAQRRCRMHEHDGLTSVELLKDRLVTRVS